MTAPTEFEDVLRRMFSDVASASPAALDLADRIMDAVATPARRSRSLPPVRWWGPPLLAAAAIIMLVVGILIARDVASKRNLPANTPTPADSASLSPSEDAATPATSSPRPSNPSIPAATSATAITIDHIENGTIDIPAWPGSPGAECPTGPRHFTNGRFPAAPASGPPAGAGIYKTPVIKDFTGDGVDDAFVALECNNPEWYWYQAFLVTGAPDGSLLTRAIGPTADYSGGDNVGATLGYPQEMTSGPGTSVVIHWENDPGNGRAPQDQNRTYTYADGKFTQTDGPATFPIS